MSEVVGSALGMTKVFKSNSAMGGAGYRALGTLLMRYLLLNVFRSSAELRPCLDMFSSELKPESS